MSQPIINLILADDHALFRKGLVFLLAQEPDFCIVAEAGDGLEAVKLAAQHPVDLMLLDLDMPIMNGIEALVQIRQQQPQLPVLILTVAEDIDSLRQCMALGASGYVLKNVDSDFLIESIRLAVRGHQIISAAMTDMLLMQRESPNQGANPGLGNLSLREQQVLQYLAQGCSNKIIAIEMSLSENTIKVHVQNILKKLNLHSRVQAAVFANEHGLGRLNQTEQKSK